MLAVRDVERSIKFYELFGFELIDTDRCETEPTEPLGWARMHCEGGALMFLRANEPAGGEGLILVMYTPDLPAFRDHLIVHGVDAPEIEYPPWMPSGALFLKDPDGYAVNVDHWGDKEHAAWLQRIGRSPQPAK